MRAARRRFLLAATLAIPLAPAAAQQTGGVRGRVYDSLAGAWLAGARVWIRGTPAAALSDAQGRFAIDDVAAGPHTIVFSHPDLDSIGLPHVARPVLVRAGAVTAVDLAVPGLPTLQRALCGSRPPLVPYGLGAIFGTVTDAETGARLAGARVEVSWVSVRWSPGQPIAVERSRDEVTTDSLGNYYQCDVPRDEVFWLAAASGPSATGKLDVLIGPRGVARYDIALSRDTAALSLDAANGLLRGRAALAGTVSDDRGEPVRGARILADDGASEAESDVAGRFVLTGLPAGSQMVMARALGYAASRRAVALRNGDTIRVAFALPGLTALDTIRVVARASHELDRLVRRLRSGAGITVTGAALRDASAITGLLGKLPSLRMNNDSAPGCRPGALASDTCMRVMSGGGRGAECEVHIWVDGYRADEAMLTAVDPRRLIALEWFPRPAQAPPEYAPNDNCGVLLVWTTVTG